MLENIKFMLGLNNEDHDKMILFYIAKLEKSIKFNCNINKLNEAIESFIEDKVYSIMKPKIDGGTQNTGEIKAVTRGDTKIEYNVGQAKTENLTDITLTEKDKKFLHQFRKVRFF